LGACKVVDQVTSEMSSARAPNEGADSCPQKAAALADSGEWSEEQETALVKAMKQFGKELEDRWERVSAVVPGKTKLQCFKRFKELRELFRSKKGGPGDNATE